MQKRETEKLRQQFLADGFVVLENFFSDEELTDVESTMNKFLSLTETEMKKVKPKDDRMEKLMTNTFNFGEEAKEEPSFIKLSQHDRMNEITSVIFGKGFHHENLLVQISTKGRGQGWHRDTHYSFFHKNNYYAVNRLIYTRDIDPEMGALYVVPGSHLVEKFPAGGQHEPIEGEMMIAPKKGTIVLCHSLTFHRVNPNETDKHRFSINYRIRPEGVPDGFGYKADYRIGNH